VKAKKGGRVRGGGWGGWVVEPFVQGVWGADRKGEGGWNGGGKRSWEGKTVQRSSTAISLAGGLCCCDGIFNGLLNLKQPAVLFLLEIYAESCLSNPFTAFSI